MAKVSKSKKTSIPGVTEVGRVDGKIKYVARLKAMKNGRRLFETDRTILADNLADCLAQRQAIYDQLMKEAAAAPVAVVSVHALIDEWIETRRPNTGRSYSSVIHRFKTEFGDRRLAEVTLREFRDHLQALPVSDSTASTCRAVLISFYEWAIEKGAASQNIARQTPRRTRQKSEEERLAEIDKPEPRKAMTKEEIDRFLSAFESREPELYLLLCTQLMIGCRIGEVIALRWKDIDEHGGVTIRHNFSQGRLSVPKNGTARHTAIGERWMARLTAHRAQLLAEQRPHAATICFPIPPRFAEHRRVRNRGNPDSPYWTYTTIAKEVRRVFTACGIDLPKGVGTHSLRHTMISLSRQENAEAVAARFLGLRSLDTLADRELRKGIGHADIATTDRYTWIGPGHYLPVAREHETRVLGPSGGESGKGSASISEN